MQGAQGSGAFWATRFGFVMAAVGSAVGLGNFWRFPYLAGENGGGAFILVYLAATLLIILPLLIAEFVIGRRGRTSAIRGIAAVAAESGGTRAWGLIGLVGILATFLILTFYSVIGGWVLSYVGLAASGAFTGTEAETVSGMFAAMLADPDRLMLNHALFMGLTVLIVMLGVNAGLETASTLLMPALVLMLIGLVIYSAIYGDFGSAIRFMFVPDWSELTAESVRDAISQGFFSVGISGALMVTYAGYARASFNLSSSAVIIVLGDVTVALLAGLAIFPIVFSHGLDAASGPGLTFVTLPIALGDLPGATFMATAFFLLLLFAAITSSISLLELPVAEAVSRGVPRPVAALLFGGIAFALGIATVYSFNIWADWYPLAVLPGLETANAFDAIDTITSKVMLPLAGILVALFAGYVVRWSVIEEELAGLSRILLLGLRVGLTLVSPVVLLIVMVANLYG